MRNRSARLVDDDGNASGRGLPRALVLAGTAGIAVDVLLASLANALNQADRTIMPVASIPMKAELGWTDMQKGVALSSFAYGYILVQLPSGWVSSRLPSLPLLFGAVLAWSLSTIITAAAARRDFSSLIACRVVMGVAEGFCLPAIFQLFARRVPTSSRSKAFAVMIGCGALGQLLGLLICPLIAPWDGMWRGFGGAGLVWCALCLALGAGRFVGRERATPLVPSEIPSEEEQELPELPVKRASSSELSEGGAGDRGVSDASSAESVRSAASKPAAERESSVALLSQLVRCRALLAICAAHFGQNWTNYLLSSWLPTYLAAELGMSTRDLSYTSIPFLANAIAGIAFGYLADALIARKVCSVLSVRRLATGVGLLGPAACHVLFTLTRSPSVAIAIVTLSFTLGACTSSGYMANHGDISADYAGR
mmetsp:Transcript_15627/g.39769  ORF Transcript_15627/g.39769 Transcript_15627/m.39769 type:complete len:425 (-) Transcript_15627:357-1631(-)